MMIAVNNCDNAANRSYSWTGPGGFTSALQCPTVSVAGTYVVTVTDTQTGCSSTCSTTVTANQQTSVCNISGALVICSGTSTTLSGDSGAISYAWSTGATTRSITVSTVGTYRLIETDANGCVSNCEVCVTLGFCRTASHGVEHRTYPNPFSEKGTVEFLRTDNTDRTIVEIYTTRGEKVATLFDQVAEQGILYKVQLDGENLPVGMYIYRIYSGGNDDVINGRMSLVK